LHKGLFIPLFDQKVPEGTRAHTLNKYESRLRYLNDHLTDRGCLLDRFTVADGYLYTVLNWAQPTHVDLKPWPAIKSYHEYLQTRPSIAKAFLEEMALYKSRLRATGPREPEVASRRLCRVDRLSN
jgi:glutathione S-transferase